MSRIPVSILTGFLGSGKTSLLNRALTDPCLNRTAVLVNEFGEIGLDHHLIASSSENVVLLENGCLCCAVKGDLVNALDGLHRGKLSGELAPFDRVIIETSGLAEPTPVIEVLLSEPTIRARFELHGVITTVDAVNGAHTLQEHIESAKQVALADRILITKTDLLPQSKAKLALLLESLIALNCTAPILDSAQDSAVQWLTAPVDDSQPQRYFDRFAAARTKLGAKVSERVLAQDGQYRPVRDEHKVDQRISSFTFVHDQPLPMATLERFLDGLRQCLGPALLRVKGLVNVEEHTQGPAVVNGAQQLLHGLNWLSQWPDEDRRTRLVFIALESAANEVQELFALVQRMSRVATR